MKTFEEFRFSIPHNKVRIYKYSPKTKDGLVEAIEAEIEFQGSEADLNCIDTSKITDMSYLFNVNQRNTYAKNFNGDISNWDVSNVINMRFMFCGAKIFNGDISEWNVINVKDMVNMFGFAGNFNQDISKWDVSNVKIMDYMFRNATSFNQDISNWDVSNVKYHSNIFDNCPVKEEYKPKFN